MLYAAELTWNGQKGIEGEYQRAIKWLGQYWERSDQHHKVSWQQRVDSHQRVPSWHTDKQGSPAGFLQDLRTAEGQRRF